MTQAQGHHQEYLKKYLHPSTKTYRPLSLQFPALTVEIKLDGERFVIHIRDGKVTMNTRNSTWYSELYAPVLGPSLRRALAKYPNVNVILDGEIESWDNSKKTLIPFGENRTVAGYRRAYLNRHGLVDPIDVKIHDENEFGVMRTATEYFKDKSTTLEEQISRGENYWLKFMAFDILYVEGPDSKRIFEDCGLEDVTEGSIINLPLLKRKQILYRLLTREENFVEICPTVVIRCNGDVVSGEEYFSTTYPLMECGYPVTLLDSTQATIQGKIPRLEELDFERQKGRTPSQISKMRAQAMDDFYCKVVEQYKFEGLVVKDLASPYLFGVRKFWWKFKPDYETGEAVDVDVVILGASFATGVRNGGAPSGYLVGVVDCHDSNCYLTLCNVNANSVRKEKTEEIWKHTGFQKGGNGEQMELGKWFREENYALPSFISERSLQRNSVEDRNGWTFNKRNTYPDLWIDPHDSVVLTIKGQELVVSDEHSTGLSMRFPKIKKVRLPSVDGDEKKPWEIDSDSDVWTVFQEITSKRADVEAGIFHASQSQQGALSGYGGPSGICRFLTPEEFSRKSKKRGRKNVDSPSRKVPKVEIPETDALEGLTFNVLEGNYSLDHDSLEGREAKEQGWLHEATRVRTEADVIEFIKRHSGTYKASKLTGAEFEFCLGGSKSDAKVQVQMKGLQRAKAITNPKTKGEKELSSMTGAIDGILKWTFVYWLVYRARKEGAGEKAIKDFNRTLLIPGPQHYLARLQRDSSVEEEIFCLDRLISKNEMQRALLDDGSAIGLSTIPWQYNGLELSEDERWVLSSKHTHFWPYHVEGGNALQFHDMVVLYPDVFSDYGFSRETEATEEILSGAESSRWANVLPNSDEIMSALLLAKAMGGLVTPHLHSGVSLILCLLKPGMDEITYEESVTSSDVFQDPERGQRLLHHLEHTFTRKKTIKFISADLVHSIPTI